MPITIIPNTQPLFSADAETLVEYDLGATPTSYATFTQTDSNVSSTSNVDMVQSGQAPTGRSADENEMDRFEVVTSPGAGQFTVWIRSLDGPVVGKYKFSYTVR